jgi:uncharacterized protein (TIGR02246 family)
MRTYSIAVVALFFVFALDVIAQTSLPKGELTHGSGVKRHAGIDAIYEKFSAAYQKLDTEMVADLYTENAAYLPPDSEVLFGRPAVKVSFASFFDSVRASKASLQISFYIVQRDVSSALSYDVGIFTLVQKSEKGETTIGKGKFIAVAKKGSNGKWLFQVDAYNNLPRSKPQ